MSRKKSLFLHTHNSSSIIFFSRSLQSLEKLFLPINGLSYVQNGTFEGLQNLTYLDLSNNKISVRGIPSIPTSRLYDVFYQRPIRSFSRKDSDNYLEGQLNVTFLSLYGIPNLQYLDLSDNAIEILPTRTFDNLKELLFLDLTKTKLIPWPRRLFTYNSKLQFIDLKHNFLGTLTDAMVSDFSSENLTVINLSFNDFECACQLAASFTEDIVDKCYNFENYYCMADDSRYDLMSYISCPPSNCTDDLEFTEAPTKQENMFSFDGVFTIIIGVLFIICAAALYIW